jgi:predicted GNAT family N-acyltransferase
MKKHIHAGVANTPASIADAQRIRNHVFVVEKALLSSHCPTIDRETDEYDTLKTTLQFVAYVDDAPVATARLIRPNPDVARAIGEQVGLDLALRYDLRPFAAAGVSFAEVSRMCVVPEHRGTAALYELYLAMYRESLRVGLTHWVGAGNTETDAIEDARIAYRSAAREGFTSNQWRVVPRDGAGSDHPSSRPFYTPEERARARAGDVEGLRLPRTLRTFAHLAARYMGDPIREKGYSVCSLPLVVDLADIVHTRAFQQTIQQPLVA